MSESVRLLSVSSDGDPFTRETRCSVGSTRQPILRHRRILKNLPRKVFSPDELSTPPTP